MFLSKAQKMLQELYLESAITLCNDNVDSFNLLLSFCLLVYVYALKVLMGWHIIILYKETTVAQHIMCLKITHFGIYVCRAVIFIEIRHVFTTNDILDEDDGTQCDDGIMYIAMDW